MRKINKFLTMFIFGCLLCAGVGINVNAEEYTVPDVVTGMDMEGNVYVIEDEEENLISTAALYSRAGDEATVADDAWIVKFKRSGVTNFNEYKTGISGYTYGPFGADAAYLWESDGYTYFMLSGVIGYVPTSEIEYIRYSNAASVSHYEVVSGKLIHYVSTNVSSSSYGSVLNQGPAPSYLSPDVAYYSYDGHYFYTDYSVMCNDYYNLTRGNSVNPDAPFYNYYQYLPLRSWSGYSGENLSSIINNKTDSDSKMYNLGDEFIRMQNTYGVNALIATGVAANESAWGTSWIAQNKNNLFGLNAVDSSPGESANYYASPADCVKQFGQHYMSKGYLYPKDWRYFGGHLGNKGSGINVKYASDPYWGEKAANVAWMIDAQLGSHDTGRFSLGIKNTNNSEHDVVNVRNHPSTSGSSVLYTTTAASNYPVIIHSSDNGFYKIQSDGIISGSSVTKSDGTYDFNSMYAYISDDYVNKISDGTGTPTRPDTPEENDTSSQKRDEYTGSWKAEGGEWYYYQDGIKLTGWHYIVNAWYYLGTDGAASKGWDLIDDIWYYFDSNNHMLTGWQYLNGNWFYMNGSGHMLTDFQYINGNWFYMNGSGHMLTGWQYIDDVWYYFNGSGHRLTGWQYLNYNWFYMDKDGKMLTDFQYINSNWFYMNGSGHMLTGWQYIDDVWYYFNGSGHRLTGWQYLNYNWFYMDKDGKMLTGFQDLNGNWFYMNGSGHMLTGWQYIDNVWYYFNGSGHRLTGWQYLNYNWFYMDEEGKMLTGFQDLNGNWFYMNGSGHMLTGWQYIDDVWYYFNGSGHRLTGWQYLNYNWFYMDEEGKMLTGWQTIDDKKYYMNSSGHMLTGWNWIGDNCYYMYSSGSLAVDTTINGYYVDESGVWIP